MPGAAEQVIAALRQQLGDTTRFIAIEAIANLTEATPVDTGWARAHWRATVGRPNTASEGRIQGARTPSGAEGGQIDPAVTRYKFGDGGIWITNNVPYIGRLRDGWSRQAPAGWVEHAIQSAIDLARQQFGSRLIIGSR